MHTNKLYFDKINELCIRKIPFFFICDFLCQKVQVIPLTELQDQNIICSNPLFTSNSTNSLLSKKDLEWEKFPLSFEDYADQFEKVKKAISSGNSYLLNLTCETKIRTNFSLEEIYHKAKAKYKLLYKDEFVHFSPEPFIKINGDNISAYPMKGTANADLKDSAKRILENKKELAEQFIIVDLIRNDLSIVASNVAVDDFWYIEKIETNEKNLLSVSSKISGTIKEEFKNRLGDILAALLPAGSICGAPKLKTVQIILNTETHQRGRYTGVWGIFDGENMDSCVIIRYLEKRNGGYFFKSGGGITAMSDVNAEYQEMIDKVYVPVY